jgi:hypothetical protein
MIMCLKDWGITVKSMEITGYRAPIMRYNVGANTLKPPIITLKGNFTLISGLAVISG